MVHFKYFVHSYFSDRGILFTYDSGWLTSGNIYFIALLYSMKKMWSTNAIRNQIAWFWNDFLNRLQLQIATLPQSNCRIAWFVTAALALPRGLRRLDSCSGNAAGSSLDLRKYFSGVQFVSFLLIEGKWHMFFRKVMLKKSLYP